MYKQMQILSAMPMASKKVGLGLLFKMIRNRIKIPTSSNFMEHAFIGDSILRATGPGIVVECGSYKGGSAANLSLICAKAGRKLHVFDSFEGLPDPDDEGGHRLVMREEVHEYRRGDWRGGLNEVRENVSRWGRVDVCEFHPGYFDETLPGFNEPVVAAFVDVDLRSSLETCLRYLWPLLCDGARFFTHEAQHHEIASLFYDNAWWKENLAVVAPGLVGAGCGVGLVSNGEIFQSALGFCVKDSGARNFPHIHLTGLNSTVLPSS
jgi:O-methyltransferase